MTSPFNNIKEMNDALIKNWNKRVKDEDTVYIIGDLFFKSLENVENILPVLPIYQVNIYHQNQSMQYI